MAGQTDGETPLIMAAASGHVEIVRTLVRAGVAVNKAKVCDHRQCIHTCAFVYVSAWRCKRIMIFLSVRVVWQTGGATPLYIASQEGHDEVVRALVGSGAAVNQARVREDWGWRFGCAWVICADDVAACMRLQLCVHLWSFGGA
jgi:hypothetical protein